MVGLTLTLRRSDRGRLEIEPGCGGVSDRGRLEIEPSLTLTRRLPSALRHSPERKAFRSPEREAFRS